MISSVSINSAGEIENQVDRSMKAHFCGRMLSQNEFTKEELIAKTRFADVYKGTYERKPVAVKAMLLRSLLPDLVPEFDPYWKVVDNQYLVHLHGICDVPGEFAMVMELMECDLYTYLTDLKIIPKHEPVPIEELLFIELRIAQGICYLHDVLGIGHMYLKDTNILLNLKPFMMVKIADFGLSGIKLKSPWKMELGRQGVTEQWSAPDVFTPEYSQRRDSLEVQKPADIYSYGMLLWQMRSREKPFQMHEAAVFREILKDGTRPDLEGLPNCSAKEKKLMTNCFSLPALRPTAKQIVQAKTEKAIFVTWLKNTPGNVFSNGQMIDISPLIAKFAFLTTYK